MDYKSDLSEGIENEFIETEFDILKNNEIFKEYLPDKATFIKFNNKER